ncbi:hypothetical protein KSF78_0005331 [Schistosoma japonicum]|nr:hypothetical protein KSF78_0005331 [Schistosoma japonicum]
MSKTVVYKQTPTNESSEYYDDEITETTWVIKLGNKNVTDKDMLDFINNQINVGELFNNCSVKQNTNDSNKRDDETQTSWFSVPEIKQLDDKWVSDFLNNDREFDEMLKDHLPGKTDTNTSRRLVSKSIWLSEDFERHLKEIDFEGILRNSFELNDIINKNIGLFASINSNNKPI